MAKLLKTLSSVSFRRSRTKKPASVPWTLQRDAEERVQGILETLFWFAPLPLFLTPFCKLRSDTQL